MINEEMWVAIKNIGGTKDRKYALSRFLVGDNWDYVRSEEGIAQTRIYLFARSFSDLKVGMKDELVKFTVGYEGDLVAYETKVNVYRP